MKVIICREEWLMLFYFLAYMQTKQSLNADNKSAWIQHLWHSAGHKSSAREKVKGGSGRGQREGERNERADLPQWRHYRRTPCEWMLLSGMIERISWPFVFWFLFDPALHKHKGMSVWDFWVAMNLLHSGSFIVGLVQYCGLIHTVEIKIREKSINKTFQTQIN